MSIQEHQDKFTKKHLKKRNLQIVEIWYFNPISLFFISFHSISNQTECQGSNF